MKITPSRIHYPILLILGGITPLHSFAETSTGNYVTPRPFLDLYYDFTGSSDPNYPKGKRNISQDLYESELKTNSRLLQQAGQLLMFIDSTFYIYDSNRKRELSLVMRTAPNSGFTEMTAISHIGPALAYLAKIKQNGDDTWQAGMESLLKDIKAVKTINAQGEGNWLTEVNAPAWKPHLPEIHNMVDYACSMAGNYISDVLSGKAPFTMASLQSDFLNGNSDYPIPYDTVMVATFMLTAIQSMTEIHNQVSKLQVEWPRAKVIVRFVAGDNVTAGVSAGSNWLVPFIKALSNGALPDERIYIAPYAQVKPSLGQAELSQEDYTYYDTVWTSVFNRAHIARSVFATIPSIYLPARAAIPGDYGFSKGTDINDFLIRLKYSLSEPTEMLSNTVGFWMAGELAAKSWDVNKVDIPGLTSGLPKSASAYPSNNREIQ